MRTKCKHNNIRTAWLALLPALLPVSAAQGQSTPTADDAHAFLQTVFAQNMVRDYTHPINRYQATGKCASILDGKSGDYTIESKITWSNIVSIMDVNNNTIKLIGSFSRSFGMLPAEAKTDLVLVFPDQTVRDRVKLAVQVLINECDLLGSAKFDAFKAPVAKPKAAPAIQVRPIMPAPEEDKDDEVIRPD